MAAGDGEALLALLHQTGSRPALVDPDSGATLSHARLGAAVGEVAVQLRSLGVVRGAPVALVLSNSIELVVTFLALASVGAAAAPINPALSAREVEREIVDLGATLVLREPTGDVAVDAAESAGVRHCTVALGPDGEILVGDSRTGRADGDAPAGADIALLLHTSGTTSRPKTVALRQQNLVHSTRVVAQAYQLSADDVSYCVMPLFHIHGLIAGVLAPLSVGGCVIVPPRFSATAFWPDVKRLGATWYTAVPTIHQVVLSVCADGRHVGHRLRFARSCSSTLPPPLWRSYEATVEVPLVEAYGMTEAAHQMATNPLPPGERRPGSVGQATGVDISVLDDRWRPVPAGERGEVCVRGPSVVGGYVDNPEANAASFRDGWFRTGDVGTLSTDGYLTLVGRIKELINRGGEKISPYEVEAVLLDHPAVAEAAVYPAPDDKYGEHVAAVVVTIAPVDMRELLAHCADHLAQFKVPATIAVRPEIPKGPTGKVQRRLLSELVAE